MMLFKWHRLASVGIVMAVAAVGCGGNAHVELAASDALVAVADQMRLAMDEYHGEVGRLDDEREGAVVSAFVVRVKADIDDEALVDGHEVAFRSALAKLRGDREVEWARYHAAAENVAVMKDVASGLQRIAIESMSLDDEMRRYFASWMDVRRRRSEQSDVGSENAAIAN